MKKSPALLVAALLGIAMTTLWLSQEKGSPATASVPARPAAQQEEGSVPAATPPESTTPADDALFSAIGGLVQGATISLPLPDGARIEGVLNYVKTHPNAATSAGGTLADGSGIFEIAREPGRYRGFVLPKDGKIAYVYSGSTEEGLKVARRPRGEVVCEPDPNFKPLANAGQPDPQKAAIYNGGRSVGILYEQIPILHSLPRAAAAIYLDFDGEVIEGQSWEGGRRIIASAYNISASEVTDMWRRVAEDFAPYEVNVTTDLQAYLRAPQGRRMRCIVTPSNFAPGAGGIAFSGTFLESGDTCCWVFMTGKAGSDAISHEIGHTLGLHHDGRGADGYFGGHGSGAASWGPIMGAPYGATVAQWSKGEYPDANQGQDDLLVMGSYVPRRGDDHAPTAAGATPLTLGAAGAVSNSGVIESPDDVDAFTFTTNGGTVTLQFNGAANSPNLDIQARLYNAAGTLITTASPANQLSASLSQSLAAGTYTVTVDGTGNATWETNGYGDYGSLGAYTIGGTVATPQWAFRVPANALAGAALGTVAPGTGSAYSLTAGNTGNAFSINSATGLISVATPGALAANGSFALTVAYTAGGSPATTAVPVTVAALRGLKQQIWTGLGGNGLGPMTSLGTYPNNPNQTRYSSIFQTTLDLDNYGQKLSGYLLPTETGNHVFWSSSDDYSEVWLSTDANPANKVRIISLSAVTSPGGFADNPNQQSAAIPLVAGQRYYMEVLHRDQTGADHMAIAWQTPALARHYIPNANLEYPGTWVNRAPWIANMTYRVREDTSAGTAISPLVAGDHEPGSVLSGFTLTAGNTGNAFSLNATTGVLSVNAALSFATLPAYLLTIQATDSNGQATSSQIAVEVVPLAVRRQLWTGVGGTTIPTLTSLATYPNNPNSTTYQSFFETPVDSADNYGQKLSGYLRAPDTGSYTFWIAADDACELWLSTDSNPLNKVRIAHSATFTNSREWGKFGTQRSAAVTLQGGRFYYIEALHKEANGGDNLAVSWSGPEFGQIMLGAPNVTQLFYNHGAPVLNDRSVTVFNRDDVVTTLEAKDWSDPGTTVTYAITAGNADGAFTIDPLTGVIRRNATQLPVGTRVLTVTATDNGTTPLSDTGLVTVQVLKAGMKREVWTGLSGSNVLTDLTGSLYYPHTPGQTGFTQNFQAPSGFGENYGQRLSGHLIPPTTGNYTFWIASDDGGELWISSNANPANKRKVASVTGSVNPVQWNAQTSQQSVVIPLTAGQSYYIEALQKEGNGGDHLAAAWQGPGISQAVIPGAFLEYPDTFRPALRREVWYGNGTTTPPARPADFEGTLFSFRSPNDIADGFSERITGYIIPPATGTYTFWLSSDDDGQLLLSTDENPANLSQIASVTGFTAPEAWDVSPSQQSAARTLVAGRRYYVEVRHRDGSFGDHAEVAWQGPGITRRIIANDHLEHPSAPTDRTLLKRELWTGIAGGNVSDLTAAATYPASPATTGTLAAGAGLAAPANAADTFGERISGYLVAPEDGRFTFWIASDESSELWLSTDEHPTNRIRIATVSGSVAEQAWDTQASQKSVPIALLTGRRYYLEILHKDGTGADHASVAWQGPSFTRRLIAGGHLENPWVIPGKPTLKRELWASISGSTVANLTANTAYINARPTARGVLTTFESPADHGDNFGQRLTADLVPPETGNYKFWIASDANSELWLSTDSTPASRIKIAQTTAVTAPREWTKYASQESGTLLLTAGQRYHIEVLHKESTGADHLAVAWQGPSFPRQIIDGRFLEYPGTLPAPAALKREVWTGIGGNDVTNLTGTATYPATPNQTLALDTFETPVNSSDNYGDKISGYLIAPFTGSYQFWIASDDGGELWLSPTDVQSGKTRIAYTTVATGSKNWTNNANQTSATITLTAGHRCYIEALHKEGGGDDYLQVAWQGPGFTQQIIPRQFLEYPGLPPADTQPTAIVPATGIDAGYTFWLTHTGLQGANRLPEADPDGDTLSNSLEFILGGLPSGPGANSTALLPQLTTDPDSAIFEFRRTDTSLTIAPFAQYATTLGTWTRATHGVDGVQITTVDDGFAPGVDRVTVRIPKAGSQKLFLRLNANMR